MTPTLRPVRSRATTRCMAVVDFPDPPFSFPRTITRAGEVARPAGRTDGLGAICTVEPPSRPSGRTAPDRWIWKRPSDRKSTRLNSSHVRISYAVLCLKKKIDSTDNHGPAGHL